MGEWVHKQRSEVMLTWIKENGKKKIKREVVTCLAA